MRSSVRLGVALLTLGFLDGVCRAQIVPPIIPRPAGGVYVDAEGVVRTREIAPPGMPRDRNSRIKPSEYRLSLKKLFDDAKSQLASGEKLSDDVRFLHGMVQIDGIEVDAASNDLVLVGRSEPFETTAEHRPRGEQSGRPVLRLEDVVVAFRIAGPGRQAQPFGCSLDMDPNALPRAAEAAQKLIATQNYEPRTIVQKMEEAIGSQSVRLFGAPDRSPFALWCLEADVRLKRLALGLDPSPIKGVKSQLELAREKSLSYSRWWFVADYAPLQVSEDGTVYRISGPRLKVLASDSPTSQSTPSASAGRFVAIINKNMAELCEAVPAFADLQNLADLGVIAAIVAADRLDERVAWDTSWIMNEFPVPEMDVPKTAEPMVNFARKNQAIQVVAGGVSLDVQEPAKTRTKSESEEKPKRRDDRRSDK